MKTGHLNQRYIDVLLALQAAKWHEQNLGRIQLQKFIFLADTVSMIWKVIIPKDGHQTYKYGPWDEDINNAADVLAFRGFIDIISLKINEDKKVDVIYQLNENGLALCQKVTRQGGIEQKLDLYKSLSLHIGKHGWNKLKTLVYAEPTYVSSKSSGWGFKFDHTDLRKNLSLRLLMDFEILNGKNYRMSKENMIFLFFKLISSNE